MTKASDILLADAIMEKPLGFSIGHQHFYIYQPSLGKLYLTQRIIDSIGLDKSVMDINPALSVMAVLKDNRKDVARLIAYNTCKTKDEVFNEVLINRRINKITELDDESITQLALYILSSDNTKGIEESIGLFGEQKWYKKAQKIKKEEGTLTFFGLSLYGTLIDFACERYGWSFEYVVWGISFTNLRMMMADSVKTVYLTDKERKKAKITKERKIISGDSKNILDVIKSSNWN